MTLTIQRNQRLTRDAKAPDFALLEVPMKHRMFYRGGSMVADAHTYAELIEALLPGYLGFDDEGRTNYRIEYFRHLALVRRAEALNADPGVLEPWERQVLEAAQTQVYGWGLGDSELYSSKDSLDLWFSSVSLDLVTTDYAPHTDITRPVGAVGDSADTNNITWLNPVDEPSFIASLHLSGHISYCLNPYA